MLGARLHPGLPDALRPAAAELYWQAFGPKLGLVLGPWPRAQRYLLRVMRADQVICALGRDGALLGIAGFRTAQGGFASGSAEDLAAVYGRAGGLWRRGLMTLLARGSAEGEGFLLDGLCVAPGMRSRGLGTELVEAICAEARQRGHATVRLEVVETNLRAIALYRRLGFQVTARQSIGPLRLAFRFSSALTMVRTV